MKITREIIINGESQNVEYELTGIELERAFNEYQSTHDKAEIVHHLTDMEYKDVPDEMIDDLASQFRTAIDNDMDDYVLKIIHNNEEILEEYKDKWKVFTVKVTQTKDRWFTIRAKDEQEADNLIANYLEENWREAEDYFEDEDAEYDTYYMEEDHCTDPDDAEVKGDD